MSKGNKSGRKAFDDFVRKAAELLAHQVQILISIFNLRRGAIPRASTAPSGMKSPGMPYYRPVDKPLTLAAYESGSIVRAHVQPVAVGDPLIPMPLFLEPGRYVEVPLEEIYQAEFASVPRRWRAVLETG